MVTRSWKLVVGCTRQRQSEARERWDLSDLQTFPLLRPGPSAKAMLLSSLLRTVLCSPGGIGPGELGSNSASTRGETALISGQPLMLMKHMLPLLPHSIVTTASKLSMTAVQVPKVAPSDGNMGLDLTASQKASWHLHR